MQGKRDSVNDIDICVFNIDGLEIFGEIRQWVTESPVSISGNRAGIKNDITMLDIFIENQVPEYIEISGLRFETLESLINRYEKVISQITNPLKNNFKRKLVEGLKKLKEK